MCAYVHAGRLVGSIASALVLVLMASAATPAPIETLYIQLVAWTLPIL
jgi:hypothetical protein